MSNNSAGKYWLGGSLVGEDGEKAVDCWLFAIPLAGAVAQERLQKSVP
jgi:hypothetical protein